jgi:hypothetical protein
MLAQVEAMTQMSKSNARLDVRVVMVNLRNGAAITDYRAPHSTFARNRGRFLWN